MKSFLRILFLTYSLYPFSQSSEFGVVEYGQKESLGMGAPIGLDYNATLIFNNAESIYTYAKDSLEGGHVFEHKNVKKDNGSSIMITKRTSEIGYNYYHDFLNKNYKYRDLGGKYVKGSIPAIAWSITNETKLVGGFNCIMAVGKFSGRDYSVWFTTDIPLPYGPWKLQGLPGLILEAYDTNKEIYFYFKSINYPMKNKISFKKVIAESESKKWMSSKEYQNYLVNSFNKAVQNGRMVAEHSGLPSREKKILMENYFIEFSVD